MFRRLFWLMLALAVPVVAADMMFADLVGYTVPSALRWVSPVLGTVMFFWGGRPFLTGAVGEIRARKPGMMLLISLAITVAFAASWGSTLGLLAHELDYWWELALLIVIMLLGHWIEMRSLGQASSALESLAALTVTSRDPVALLETQAATRVPELVPIRYGRMAASEFPFFRGAALVMADDLSRSPSSGSPQWPSGCDGTRRRSWIPRCCGCGPSSGRTSPPCCSARPSARYC